MAMVLMNPFATQPADTHTANLQSTDVFCTKKRPGGFKRLMLSEHKPLGANDPTLLTQEKPCFPNVPRQAGFDMKMLTRL